MLNIRYSIYLLQVNDRKPRTALLNELYGEMYGLYFCPHMSLTHLHFPALGHPCNTVAVTN
jgi:hypothetical protein